MSDLRIGIDFGPTTARAAWVEGETSVLLETPVGQNAFPTVVGLDKKGALHVGETARRQLLLFPERTAHKLRRLLGTTHRFELDHKPFSPTELCAVVLSQIRDFAEERLGQPVQGATIAVPCHFAPEQHQDLIGAARLAGFRLAQTVLEPLAVARAHALSPRQALGPVLVVDMGATHIESTVLLAQQNKWSVLATACRETGSSLCEERLIEHLERSLLAKYGLPGFSQHKMQLRLRLAAEWAKVRLSQMEQVTVRLPAVPTPAHKPMNTEAWADLETVVSREQLALLVEDDLRPALEVIDLALRQARVSKTALFAVLLSGGAMRLPLLQQMVAAQTVTRVWPCPAPEETIARGAAHLAVRAESS